jgi:hypothetical protein
MFAPSLNVDLEKLQQSDEPEGEVEDKKARRERAAARKAARAKAKA